jgi:hypothetical protein
MIGGKKDDRVQMSAVINFQNDTSQISISKDGRIEIHAATIEELRRLRFVSEVAIRRASERASGWMSFSFSVEDEIDLETNQPVQIRPSVDVSVHSFTIDNVECENAIKSLISTSSEAILFLRRSTDLVGFAEISALSALTALELELGLIIPDEDLQVAQKLEVIRYLGLLSGTLLGKLKNLFTLRNKLAHGVWGGEKFAAALGNALGGSRDNWVIPSVGRMKQMASSEVIKQVIDSLGFLSPLRRQ